MINLLSNAVRLANSPEAPRCQGWDANDPAGCWTHDGPAAGGIDYCDGFRLFEHYEDALAYGEILGKKAPFTLGFDEEIQRWVVTPLNGTYGS